MNATRTTLSDALWRWQREIARACRWRRDGAVIPGKKRGLSPVIASSATHMMAVWRRKRLAWQLMSLLLAASVTLGALAQPVVDSTSSGQTQRTSLTISHTTGAGADRLMLVGVTINNKNSETVSSVTYNAVALTLVGTVASTTDTRVEIWRLIAPPTGTYNVVITFSATVMNGAKAGVATFTGVHQTTPLGTFASANADSVGPATVNVTSAADELVFDTVGCEGNDTATLCSSLAAGAGQTQRWNLTGLESQDPADQPRGAGSTKPGAASVTPPNFQAAGTAQFGSLFVSPPWPAHAVDDIALLFVESAGGEPATLTTPAGFVEVLNSPQATGATTAGTRITVFWARATSAAMPTPRVADPGNHVHSQILTYRGVINTGDPWDVTGGGVKAAASTTVTVTGVTTTVPNTLIVQAVSRDNDSDAAAFSAQTNANLTSITERSDRGTVSGNGGGFAVWDGVKAAAGATGDTTATVTSSINAFLTIALTPAPPSTMMSWTIAPATAVPWAIGAVPIKPSGASAPVVDAVSSGDTRPASLTISHTTGAGADRLMLVGSSFITDELETVSSVTYNAVALTLVGSVASLDDPRVEIWRLIAPPTGTFNVVITFSAPLRREAVAGVMTFTGVHQTTPLGTFASAAAQAPTTEPTVNVTSAADELVFDTVACESCTSYLVGAGQFERWNLQGTTVSPIRGAGSTEPGAATVTMSWTRGTDDHWAIGAVSIKPLAAPGDFNAFETSTGSTATGVIKTKIAGATISHDIIRLNAARTAIDTTFTGTVRVEVLNASNNSGAFDGNGCRSSWTVIQTLSPDPAFVAGDLGRKTISFTEANSYPEVRLRITYPAGAPTKIGCSNDAFAIRPNTFASFAVTDNDWETAGTGRPLNDVTFGTVIHKAGRPLSGRATALNAAGTPAVTTNYAGTPTVTFTACVGAACTATFGTMGSLPFVAGQLTSDVASYDNVGSFALQLVDSTFSNVDAADGSTTTERNITSAVINVGRFVPDHFAVALNTPVFGSACGSFTYIGQVFNYASAPVITVTAQNFTNGTTTLYTGVLWRITNASLTSKSYTAATGTLDTSGITGTDPVISSGAGGVGTLTFGSGTGLSFTRTTPVAPFDADISLAINVIDADGVAYASNPARFGTATAGNGIAFSSGKPMRFGRLVVRNANGSQLLPLPVQVEAQYWSGAPTNAFITNTLDNCTTIATANNAMGPYTANLSACETAISGGGALSMGRKTLQLAAPGAAKNGSVTLTVNLGASASGNTCTAIGGGPGPATTTANLPYLRGGANYDQDPTARATFGVSRGAEEVIFVRENF